VSDLKVILIIPDRNTGARLSDHLSAKYGVTVTLWNDLQGIAEAQADAMIIYRKSIESMSSLEQIEGKIALLYGNMPVPVTDRGVSYTKLTGNLPGCVYSFMESFVGWQGESDLTWGETSNLDLSPQPTRSVAIFSPGGGVGKTTAVVHMAKLANKHVLMLGSLKQTKTKEGC